MERDVIAFGAKLVCFSTSINSTEHFRVITGEAHDLFRFRVLLRVVSFPYLFTSGWESEMGMLVGLFSVAISNGCTDNTDASYLGNLLENRYYSQDGQKYSINSLTRSQFGY